MQPSVIIEKSRSAVGDFYEKYQRFGLVLGQLAKLKKNWADYEQLLRVVFSCCQGQKKDLHKSFFMHQITEKEEEKMPQILQSE